MVKTPVTCRAWARTSILRLVGQSSGPDSHVTSNRHRCPDHFDYAEGPRACNEAVRARQDAPYSEGENVPGVAALQGIHEHHERDCGCPESRSDKAAHCYLRLTPARCQLINSIAMRRTRFHRFFGFTPDPPNQGQPCQWVCPPQTEELVEQQPREGDGCHVEAYHRTSRVSSKSGTS